MKHFTKQYVDNYTTEGKTKDQLRKDVQICSILLSEFEIKPKRAAKLYEIGKKATRALFNQFGDYALWSTAYINNLPDSAFAFVEKGGKRDLEGKTTPRTLRHLPFENAKGEPDLPHIRNALARIDQVKDKNGKPLSETLQAEIRSRLEKMLKKNKKKSTAMTPKVEVAPQEPPELKYNNECMGCGFKAQIDGDSKYKHCSKCGAGFIKLGKSQDLEVYFEDADYSVARVFGHPTGKMWMMKSLIAMLPEHKTFVEPFAGSATIFFGKEKEEKAVLNDMGVYAGALQAIKSLTDEEIKYMAGRDWKSTPAKFREMRAYKPKTKLEKLYRFTWLQRFSYGCMGKTYDWTSEGATSTLRDERRWRNARDRMSNTTISAIDYKECIKRYDSPDTVFYLDPPYYDLKDGRTKNMGLGVVTIDDFIAGCKLVKQGKFVATVGYGNDWAKKLKEAGFNVYNVQSGRQVTTRYYGKHKKQMLVPVISNYEIDAEALKARNGIKNPEVASAGSAMEFMKEHFSDRIEVHSIDSIAMSQANPSWLELTGILFHRGMHKGVMYEDEALKTARLVPRAGENMCYVDVYHKKDESHRIGILADIWWDAEVAWYCPNNDLKGKGALMYRSFITDKLSISEIIEKKIGNVSAELHFDTYRNPKDETKQEYAAHIEVNGKAITSTPALKAADIEQVCIVERDGSRSCQKMKNAQVK